jgi:hypothetical protein
MFSSGLASPKPNLRCGAGQFLDAAGPGNMEWLLSVLSGDAVHTRWRREKFQSAITYLNGKPHMAITIRSQNDACS